MQSKFFGSCTGAQGSKYDTWVVVKENSQNESANLSNITVEFYLKRNDGFTNSAYNLSTEDNSVVLSVGGVKRFDKGVKIDTRNGATVLLAKWAGDVFHNSTGELNLSIEADFSINHTQLSSGSVSGNHKCTTISHISTMTLSSSTINPGGSVTATVKSFSGGYNHKIVFSLNEYTKTFTLNANVNSVSCSIPVDWACAVTNSTSANIGVTLYTYVGSAIVGKRLYNIGFVVPDIDAYKPSFQIGLTKHDKCAVPSNMSEYILGISSVQVEPIGVEYKYGAQFKAVTITVGAVTQRTSPAIFTLGESGEMNITVALRDTRGLVTVKNLTITVYSYSLPSVNITSLSRCLQDGTPNESGTYISVKYKLLYSSVNNKNICTVNVKHQVSGGSYSTPVSLSGGSAVFGGNIAVNNSCTLLFTVCDSISTDGVVFKKSVPSAVIPFNIKRGGKGAAFGRFSEKDNELSVGWNLSVAGDVDVLGMLKYKDIDCVCKDNVKELYSLVRYYPCVDGCFVRLRFVSQTTFLANRTYYVAQVLGKIPNMFTPLNCFINFSSGGQSMAGIVYATGEIVFRSSVDILPDTKIYVSGFFIADYN